MWISQLFWIIRLCVLGNDITRGGNGIFTESAFPQSHCAKRLQWTALESLWYYKWLLERMLFVLQVFVTSGFYGYGQVARQMLKDRRLYWRYPVYNVWSIDSSLLSHPNCSQKVFYFEGGYRLTNSMTYGTRKFNVALKNFGKWI